MVGRVSAEIVRNGEAYLAAKEERRRAREAYRQEMKERKERECAVMEEIKEAKRLGKTLEIYPN